MKPIKMSQIPVRSKQVYKAKPEQEHTIQDAICKFMVLCKWFVVRYNSGSARYGESYVKFYKVCNNEESSGHPDLLCFKNNRVLALEVKAAKGLQSKGQKKFEESFKFFGNNYYIVRNIEDVQLILKKLK